jgi:hypothetical protein
MMKAETCRHIQIQVSGYEHVSPCNTYSALQIDFSVKIISFRPLCLSFSPPTKQFMNMFRAVFWVVLPCRMITAV